MLSVEDPEALGSPEAWGKIDIIDYIDVAATGPHEAPRRVPKGAILTAFGWGALDYGRAEVTGVYVAIDGGLPLEALYGIERQDVAGFFGNERLARTGFRGVLSTAHLGPGEHVLSIAVRDAEGRLVPVSSADETFTIEADLDELVATAPPSDWETIINIDSLSVDGRPAGEPLEAEPESLVAVRGWAIDAPARSAGTAIFGLIGSSVVKAVYGFSREDVADIHPDGDYRNCGFALQIPLGGLPPGEHTLRLRLVGADGATVHDGPAVRVDVVDFPLDTSALTPAGSLARANIDEAVVLDAQGRLRPGGRDFKLERGDQLFVRGWAVDEVNDAPARAVHLVVDDLPSVPAVYGLERPDVAGVLGKPQFAASGFTGLVATSSLADGPHTLALRVIASDGRRFYDTLQRIEFTVR